MSAEIASLGVVRAVLTLVLFIAFIALWIWAWSKHRRADFEAAALLPLEEGAQQTHRSEHP